MLQDSDTIRISDVSEAVVHGILEVISDGIWDWNANTGFVYRNPGWYRMLGYEPHTLGNNVFTWESVIHPDDMDRVMASFDAYLSGAAPDYRVEYRCRSRGGDYIWIEDCGRIIERNPDGSVARMIGAHRNIHASKLLLEQLELRNQSLEQLVAERTAELVRVNEALQQRVEENRQLAETDALTGAASRYRLERALQLECERARRFHLPFTVIAMDVDNFKQINDSYGHNIGDQTLINIVALVRDHIREIDLLARWGGDEFMVLLPNTGREDALVVANKFQALMVTNPICPRGVTTMSFGVAEYQQGEQKESLMVRADRALYQAKQQGKNQIC
ncbi:MULTISPECIES: sensor domain-containing diguanylate cyclase [Aeromonas]|uniref:sensor domain-containing diguanylate cyclase n=1 Tax=Aeromonas TaxID=642 RepID=UPI001C23D760|nr:MULTISPECIES: sensor domain-containing diguanylate cyclase [Aeromonas]MCX4046653.1 diguanylate cyclase [Aeromonas veronii]QWZ80938.1 diguanylate cyclase [Aeromonas sp. FDAARGOS 1414]UDN22680.1 diguanylate cyclase [Aeromonas veronii]